MSEQPSTDGTEEQPSTDGTEEQPPSRPGKLSWAVAAIALIGFIVFVFWK